MELNSKLSTSGSNEQVETSDWRSFLDFGSASGNKIPWMESKTSRTNCRGRTPLVSRQLSAGRAQPYEVTYLSIDNGVLKQSLAFLVTRSCSLRKAA